MMGLIINSMKSFKNSDFFNSLCIIFSLLNVVFSHHFHLMQIVVYLPRYKIDFLEQFLLMVFKLSHCYLFVIKQHPHIPKVQSENPCFTHVTPLSSIVDIHLC